MPWMAQIKMKRGKKYRELMYGISDMLDKDFGYSGKYSLHDIRERVKVSEKILKYILEKTENE